MEQAVLFKDVLPYIQIWTYSIIIILAALAYHIWRFCRKYPEIFQPDTTADNNFLLQRKADLRRLYYKKSMSALALAFIWMIGLVVIFSCFEKTNMNLFALFIGVFSLLWVLLMIQRR